MENFQNKLPDKFQLCLRQCKDFYLVPSSKLSTFFVNFFSHPFYKLGLYSLSDANLVLSEKRKLRISLLAFHLSPTKNSFIPFDINLLSGNFFYALLSNINDVRMRGAEIQLAEYKCFDGVSDEFFFFFFFMRRELWFNIAKRGCLKMIYFFIIQCVKGSLDGAYFLVSQQLIVKIN